MDGSADNQIPEIWLHLAVYKDSHIISVFNGASHLTAILCSLAVLYRTVVVKCVFMERRT
jgi:hypothetical protein